MHLWQRHIFLLLPALTTVCYFHDPTGETQIDLDCPSRQIRMMLYMGQITFSPWIYICWSSGKEESPGENRTDLFVSALKTSTVSASLSELVQLFLLLLLLVFQVTLLIHVLVTHCWKLMPNGWCCHCVWRTVFSIRLCAIQSWRFVPFQKKPRRSEFLQILISKFLVSLPKCFKPLLDPAHHTERRSTANMPI